MRPLAAPLLSVAAAVGLVACGGGGAKDNGVASKSPAEILAAAQTAVQGAKSVHLSGSVLSSGQTVRLDLDILSGRGAKGEISESGLSFQLLSSGSTVYIKGSSAFLKHFAGNTAAQVFAGKWLKGSATGQLAAITQFTNLPALFGQLVAGHGTLAKGATTTLGGQKAVSITDTQKHGTMYVATAGQPYPLQVGRSGNAGGSLTFDHYNESVSLTPPSGAIDITQFLK
jgi:hypothetical protein